MFNGCDVRLPSCGLHVLRDLRGSESNADLGAVRQFDVIDLGILHQVTDDRRRVVRIVQIDLANLVLGAIGQLVVLVLERLVRLDDLQVLHRRPDDLAARVPDPRGNRLLLSELHIPQTHQIDRLAGVGGNDALYLSVRRLCGLQLVVLRLVVVVLLLLMRRMCYLLDVDGLVLLLVLLVVRLLRHMLDDVVRMDDSRVSGNRGGGRDYLFDVDQLWNKEGFISGKLLLFLEKKKVI